MIHGKSGSAPNLPPCKYECYERKIYMKKFLSLALSLVLVVALAVPALAASETLQAVGTKDIEVNATVSDGTNGSDTTVHNYYVVIEWSITNPTFTKAGVSGKTYTWNGETGKYDVTDKNDGSAKTSADGSATVTVTNRSDLNIKVSATYAAEATNGTTWAGSDDTETTVATIVANTSTDYSGSDFNKQVYTGAVKLNDYEPAVTGKIGTITVTIKAGA